MSLRDFQQVVRAAVTYFTQHGYTSQKALDIWSDRIAQAARDMLISPEEASEQIARSLGNIYGRVMRKLPRHMKELQTTVAGRMGPEMFFRRVSSMPELAHKMRTELDRKIATNVDLIKIRREESMAATLRRFKGWASSVPPSGTPTPPSDEVDLLLKDFRKVRFETNRLNIDQGHKLNSALNAVLANNTGAIAGEWHSHWRQTNYNYRVDHKERDLEIYTIRGNWAEEAGLMHPGPAGYTDEITQPAEEVNCRCFYRYIYNLNRLPQAMLTEKGKRALEALDAA